MYKILSLFLVTSCLGLSGCATTLLDQTFPKESTQTTSITLKQDQIIALGQAVQNQTEQGLVYIGKDFNYLKSFQDLKPGVPAVVQQDWWPLLEGCNTGLIPGSEE